MSTPTSSSRITSLDGLRGIAALVVMVHHSILAVPSMATGYFRDQTGGPLPGTVEWAATYTPLHVLWAGGEAVVVFFVLSGVVLTFPVLRGAQFSWRGYYPQRLVRLYLPICAVVALGTLLAVIFDRHTTGAQSAWISSLPSEPSSSGAVKDLTLLGGTSGLISPLWSLRWEIIFSLLLPLYLAGALIFRRLWALKLVGIFALVACGALATAPAMMYLPIFAAGTVLAVEWDRAGRLACRLGTANWLGIMAASLLCLVSAWLLAPTGSSDIKTAGTSALTVAGATALVFVAGFWQGATRVLNTSWLQWLGRISFSLYLIHEPVAIALAVAFGPDRAWLVLPTMLAVGPAAAAVFFRLVELPSHRLARVAGRRFTRRSVAV